MNPIIKRTIILVTSIILFFVLFQLFFPLIFPGELESTSYAYNTDNVITQYGMYVAGDQCEFSIDSWELYNNNESKAFHMTMNPLSAKRLDNFIKNLSISNPGLFNNKPVMYNEDNKLNIHMQFNRREKSSSLDYNGLPNNIDEINNLISNYYREKIIEALAEPYFIKNTTGINFLLEFKLSEKEEVRIYSTPEPERIIFRYDYEGHVPGFQDIVISEDELRDYLALVSKSLENSEGKPSFSGNAFMLRQGDAYNELRYKTYEIATSPYDAALYQAVVNNDTLYPMTIVYDQAGINEAMFSAPYGPIGIEGLELGYPDKAMAFHTGIARFIDRHKPNETKELFRGFIPEGKTQLEFFREYPKDNLKWLVFGCHADSRYALVYGGSEYPDGWQEYIKEYLVGANASY